MSRIHQPKPPPGRHPSAQGNALGKSPIKNTPSPEGAKEGGEQLPKLLACPAKAGKRRRNELNEVLAESARSTNPKPHRGATYQPKATPCEDPPEQTTR